MCMCVWPWCARSEQEVEGSGMYVGERKIELLLFEVPCVLTMYHICTACLSCMGHKAPG